MPPTMADPDPTGRTGNRRRRTSTTNTNTASAKPTVTTRHVEFSDLPPVAATSTSAPRPPPSSLSDYSDDGDSDDQFDAAGAHSSLLDLADGNASVMTAHTEVSMSARSFASVDTERTEKAGNSRRRNVPSRVGVGTVSVSVSAAQARKNAELAKRLAGYEEQYQRERAEKGRKRGRNRNANAALSGGNSSNMLPSSGFQARAALAAAQGRAAAAAGGGGGAVGGVGASSSGSDGGSPGDGSDVGGAQPEAKVVAEVMAELEAELDAEEDEERNLNINNNNNSMAAAGATTITELRRSRSGDPAFAGGGGRRSRSGSNQRGLVEDMVGGASAAAPTELRRYKSAGPEHLPSIGGGGAEMSKRSTASSGSGVSTAAVAGSNPKLTRSRRRSSHQREKDGGGGGSGGGGGDGNSNSNSNSTNPAAADATVPDVADKDVEAAAALFQMGQMEMANGNFEAAARCLEQALIMNQTALGMDHPLVGDIQHSLGLVQIEYGKYETACMTLWEAQRIRKLNMNLVGAADSLQEIGKVHRQGGRTELALDCYGECLRVRRAELGDDNLKVADAYCDLGHTEGDLGRNTDALQHFKNALTILKLNSMNDSGLDGRGQLKHGDQICHLLQKMSKMELDFGDVDHALAHLQEFVETRRLIGRTSDVAYVEALVNVGRISKDHNGDEGTAYDVLVEAVEVFDANRLGEINYGSHARLGQEVRDLLRELGGSAGTSQKSIFKRFGVGFDSLSDEIG